MTKKYFIFILFCALFFIKQQVLAMGDTPLISNYCLTAYIKFSEMQTCPRREWCLPMNVVLNEVEAGNSGVKNCEVRGYFPRLREGISSHQSFRFIYARGPVSSFSTIQRANNNNLWFFTLEVTADTAEAFRGTEYFEYEFQIDLDDNGIISQRETVLQQRIYFSQITCGKTSPSCPAVATEEDTIEEMGDTPDENLCAGITCTGGRECVSGECVYSEGEGAVEYCFCGDSLRCVDGVCTVSEADAEACAATELPACGEVAAELGIPPGGVTSTTTLRSDLPVDQPQDQTLITGGGACQLNPLAAPQGLHVGWLVLLAGLVWLRRRKK